VDGHLEAGLGATQYPPSRKVTGSELADIQRREAALAAGERAVGETFAAREAELASLSEKLESKQKELEKAAREQVSLEKAFAGGTLPEADRRGVKKGK
jgi:hypothetical protein